MTEREMMLAGQFYDARDADPAADRRRARNLCQQLNASTEAEEDRRRELCRRIFGAGGDTVWR